MARDHEALGYVTLAIAELRSALYYAEQVSGELLADADIEQSIHCAKNDATKATRMLHTAHELARDGYGFICSGPHWHVVGSCGHEVSRCCDRDGRPCVLSEPCLGCSSASAPFDDPTKSKCP